MKKLFLPYELALIAKEKGFDEPCLMYYMKMEKWQLESKNERWRRDNDNGFYLKSRCQPFGYPINTTTNSNIVNGKYNITAPLYQQIIDWFEKREIFINTHLDISDGTFKWYYSISIITDYKLQNHKNGTACNSKNNALNDAIQEAFKLI